MVDDVPESDAVFDELAPTDTEAVGVCDTDAELDAVGLWVGENEGVSEDESDEVPETDTDCVGVGVSVGDGVPLAEPPSDNVAVGVPVMDGVPESVPDPV